MSAVVAKRDIKSAMRDTNCNMALASCIYLRVLSHFCYSVNIIFIKRSTLGYINYGKPKKKRYNYNKILVMQSENANIETLVLVFEMKF